MPLHLVILNSIFLVSFIALLIRTIYFKQASTKNSVIGKLIVYFFITNTFLITNLINQTLWLYSYGLILLIGVFEIIKMNRSIKYGFYIKSFFVVLIVGHFLLLYRYLLLGYSGLYIASVYFIVVCTDGFNQLSGVFFGKTHFLKKLSPGKTIEGYVGGFVLTFTFSTLFLKSFFIGLPYSISILIVLLVILTSNIGDLIFSGLKRHYKIKDFSKIIPYHGGILDRFDSFIFASFCLYLITH